MHLVVTVTRLGCVAERAAVVVVMIGVAVMPVPIVCPTAMSVPPTRPIAPIPRTMPSIPCVAPEPIVDNRTVNIYRLDDIVGTIYVLIANYLNGNNIRLILLYIDRSNILIDILCEDRLQHDQTLVAFTRFYHAQVIYFTVSVEIEITESAVRVVEHRLELFQVLSLCK